MVSDLTCSTFLWRITVSTPLSPWSVHILAPLSCPVLKDAKETPNVYEAVRVRDNGSGSGGRTCQNRAPGKRFHRAHRRIQRLAAQAARRPCAGAGAQQRRRRIAGQARRQGTAKGGKGREGASGVSPQTSSRMEAGTAVGQDRWARRTETVPVHGGDGEGTNPAWGRPRSRLAAARGEGGGRRCCIMAGGCRAPPLPRRAALETGHG